MKIALSITVEQKSDGTFDVVSPSLLNGKPTTYSFCSPEAIGEHIGDIIYGIFDVPAVYERFGVVPAVYEGLALKTAETAGVVKFAERRGKE